MCIQVHKCEYVAACVQKNCGHPWAQTEESFSFSSNQTIVVESTMLLDFTNSLLRARGRCNFIERCFSLISDWLIALFNAVSQEILCSCWVWIWSFKSDINSFFWGEVFHSVGAISTTLTCFNPVQLLWRWRTSRSVHTACLSTRTERRPSVTTVGKCCGGSWGRVSSVKVRVFFFWQKG